MRNEMPEKNFSKTTKILGSPAPQALTITRKYLGHCGGVPSLVLGPVLSIPRLALPSFCPWPGFACLFPSGRSGAILGVLARSWGLSCLPAFLGLGLWLSVCLSCRSWLVPCGLLCGRAASLVSWPLVWSPDRLRVSVCRSGSFTARSFCCHSLGLGGGAL
ncbi:MAG: hypothetical protein ACRKFN_10505 [Desulfitobacterium sp.]